MPWTSRRGFTAPNVASVRDPVDGALLAEAGLVLEDGGGETDAVADQYLRKPRRDPIRTVALVAVTIIVGIGCAVLGWELLHSAAGATLGGALGVGLLHLLVMLSE